MERWAVRLALWLDRDGQIAQASKNFGPALRLLGVSAFRDGQLPIVEAALSGRSLLVVSPTGSGKTLCFQLPALLKPGLSLVISPLKVLMAQQVSDLLRKQVPATFINSDLFTEEKGIRYELAAQSGVKLLHVAPERFNVRSSAERQAIASLRPAFLVIDEAHCVDQWGRDFRPSYGALKEVRESLGRPPVLAFTATAGRPMQERILGSLGIKDAQVFVRGVDRPNIALLRRRVARAGRADEIAALCRLHRRCSGKLMIFVPTRKIGEALQSELEARGVILPFYHSKLSSAHEREEIVQRFLGRAVPPIDQIICTNAFGMGLDVPDVRLVVHWQQPATVEDYLQQFGRAGRDGKASVAITYYEDGEADLDLLRFMARKTVDSAELSGPEAVAALQIKEAQIKEMDGLLRGGGCFRKRIVLYFEGASVRKRPSLAMRILQWLFSQRAPRIKLRHCCDMCDSALLKGSGFARYLETVLGMPTGNGPPGTRRS